MRIIEEIYPTAPLHNEGPHASTDLNVDGRIGFYSEEPQSIKEMGDGIYYLSGKLSDYVDLNVA